MKKLVFSGCSFTAGAGWSAEHPNMIDTEDRTLVEIKDSPYLWTNLFRKTTPRFENLESINVSKSGSSNTDIFESTVDVMVEHGDQIDTLFCQWTAMPRYQFNIGFELWNTQECLHTEQRSKPVNLNRGDSWPREYIADLLDRFKALHHLHWEIVKVVKYCDIITKLKEKLGILNVFFINGLCPWDKHYFNKLDNVLPESYTPFTKTEILNIKTRDDKDIFKLYDLAHDHYTQAGGIDESRWINLYDSFLDNRIDYNFDGTHPGERSNQLYSQLITERLRQLQAN